ncbi:hypothetical protein AB0H71_33760 [Nocardia sp. NPDC050697]|uniref:hypothetical protein n=1 Tax=Nocardia sp. NPDC050697 TaxID=3155158 RepID=UPI0033DB87D9
MDRSVGGGQWRGLADFAVGDAGGGPLGQTGEHVVRSAVVASMADLETPGKTGDYTVIGNDTTNPAENWLRRRSYPCRCSTS